VSNRPGYSPGLRAVERGRTARAESQRPPVPDASASVRDIGGKHASFCARSQIAGRRSRAHECIGDGVIAPIVNIRRLLRGESDRPRPSQWRLRI
jgi:hypothetical protein